MKFIIDHDLHIHSQLSLCSQDPEQTPENILRWAQAQGLRTICVTDHFWDEAVPGAIPRYEIQNYAHVSQSLPLPQMENVRFLFGCETDLDKYLTLSISPEKYDLFDFILVATTHLHLKSLTRFDYEEDIESKAKAWLRRLDAVLSMDLPFHKVGFAHLTCSLMERDRAHYLQLLDLLPEAEMRSLFTRAAKLGVGIELNAVDMNFADAEADTVLRMYRIAKDCGCKFYLGGDAHHMDALYRTKPIFERAIELLGLTEEDKFRI